MAYRYAFFDLDGTLIDSSPGIFNSIRYTAKKMGLIPPTEEQMTSFIGPPVVKSFARHYGLSDEDSACTIGIYREYYSVTGVLECTVYDGMQKTLEMLNAQGIVCVLATCKPHVYADRIVEHLGLKKHLAFVSGPELDGTRGEKREVIAYAMEQLGITDHTEILMVGDRDNDVLGSKYHDIDCAGALWGFGSAEELTEAGAKHLCRHPLDLIPLFQK